MPDDEYFSSTALDLTLHPSAYVFKENVSSGLTIDPGREGYKYTDIADLLTETVSTSPYFSLKTHKLLLAYTHEFISLPVHSRLAARVEGKSSLSRIGIGVHITAPTIHAGFEGQLQLEIIKHGPTDVNLRAGMRICQIIFETTLGAPEKGYSGLFSGQRAH